MDERYDLLKFPWIPDMVYYTAMKYNYCSLCAIEKEKDPSFRNEGCPHCKSKTQTIQGIYTPKKKKVHLDSPLNDCE